MSSYNKFHNNCLRDSVIVSLTCCGSSFYAGFVCFSVLGFMAYEAGVPVSDVVTSGPGLAFTVYPEAITKLPISPLWAICFFLMLLTLGLDSQFGMMETCTSGFTDEFPKLLRHRRLLFTAFYALLQFVIGLPLVMQGGLYLFQILDWYAAAFSAMLIAFLECIVLAWIYKVDRLYRDIALMLGSKPCLWWKICWCYVTPLTMSAMVVYSAVQMAPPTYGDYQYPSWAITVGWVVAMCSIVPMPGIALYRILKAEGPLILRIKMLIRPTDVWGPNSSEHRAVYRIDTVI
jgi:solute carrier family 6 amino acid transporter-like protein 5/7/9/14